MPWINNAPLQDLFKDSVDRCSQQMLRKLNNRFVVSIAPGTLTISCRAKNWMQLPFPAYSLKPIIDGNYLISTQPAIPTWALLFWFQKAHPKLAVSSGPQFKMPPFLVDRFFQSEAHLVGVFFVVFPVWSIVAYMLQHFWTPASTSLAASSCSGTCFFRKFSVA